MLDEVSDAQSRAGQCFWHQYLSILEKASRLRGSRPYYRKAMGTYIKAHPERRSAQHGPDEIDRYGPTKADEVISRNVVAPDCRLFVDLALGPSPNAPGGVDLCPFTSYAPSPESN